jgi:hypothetical protein
MNGLSKLRRRLFLRALGLGVSAPLALRMSRLAAAAPGDRTKRLLVVYIPNGMPAEHYDPGGKGKDFDLLANPKVGVLKPFKPYQDQFILLRGIEYAGRTQHQAINTVFTGDTPSSVDSVVAKSLGTKPLLLGAVAYLKDQFGPDNNIFRNTEWVPPELNPVKAADDLWKGGSGGTPKPAATGDDEFQKAALALGIGEIEALQRELASLTSAQTRLGVHLDSLRSLKDRMGPGAPGLPGTSGPPMTAASCMTAPPLPAVDVVRAASMGGKNPLYFYDKSNFKPIFMAQMEVARQALLCGTRVVGLQAMWASAQINFGFMGVNKDHHDPISHSRDFPGREEFARVQQWIYGQLEEQILRPLRAAPDPFDPGRKVLDNTLVYITSEIADGNEHNCRKAIMEIGATKITTLLPTILIGGGGGGVLPGQVVDFENRSHKDLLATICAAMGASGASFSAAPIKEVLA